MIWWGVCGCGCGGGGGEVTIRRGEAKGDDGRQGDDAGGVGWGGARATMDGGGGGGW